MANSASCVRDDHPLTAVTTVRRAKTLLVSDATILLRDMAGDAAQTAANKVNPSQDRLAQIDRPADDNTWHDTPELSVSNLKNQARETFNKNSPLSKKDIKDAAGDANQAADPNDSRDPRETADKAARDQQTGGSSGVDAVGGAKAGVQSLANKIPQEHKGRANEMAQNAKASTKNYLGKKMPQERRDQTIWRLKKMVVEIQGHQDCKSPSASYPWHPCSHAELDQQAVTTLLDLAESYGGHTKNLTQQGAGTVKGAHADDSLRTVEADLRVCYRTLRCKQCHADKIQDTHRALCQFHLRRRLVRSFQQHLSRCRQRP